MRAISTTWRHELSSSFFFFPLQCKIPKEIHTILTKTLGEHVPLYATVKNWVAQFKRDDFSTCDAPCPWWPKTITTKEIIDQIHELILEDRQISAKSIAEQLGISCEWVSTRSITHLCWCSWRTFWRENTAGRSPRGSCSCTTMPRLTGHLQPRRNWPTWASVVYSLDLAPSDYHLFPGLKKQLKDHHFSSDVEVIAATETWLDSQPSEFFWVACKS